MMLKLLSICPLSLLVSFFAILQYYCLQQRRHQLCGCDPLIPIFNISLSQSYPQNPFKTTPTASKSMHKPHNAPIWRKSPPNQNSMIYGSCSQSTKQTTVWWNSASGGTTCNELCIGQWMIDNRNTHQYTGYIPESISSPLNPSNKVSDCQTSRSQQSSCLLSYYEFPCMIMKTHVGLLNIKNTEQNPNPHSNWKKSIEHPIVYTFLPA